VHSTLFNTDEVTLKVAIILVIDETEVEHVISCRGSLTRIVGTCIIISEIIKPSIGVKQRLNSAPVGGFAFL